MLEAITGILIGGLIVWLALRFKGGHGADNSFLLIQGQLSKLTETLDKKISESHHSMRAQIGESNKLIQDITRQITQVNETNKQVINVTEQLKVLQNILQNPKQRGVLGEYFLETVLKNVLPPEHFTMQYKFDDGDVVDAVIFFGKDENQIFLPIDSKFSMENYNRLIEEKNEAEQDRLEQLFVKDLKTRITETAKYIRPKERTMDFAFMFIPSEAIFYDLLSNTIGSIKSSARNLIEFAFEKNVLIVSPTTFMAYLQTVMQGLRALKIEESAKDIQLRVQQLGKHIGAFDLYMGKLGDSLITTVNLYNTAHKELNKIDKDVLRMTGDSAGVEPIMVNKPIRDD